MISTLIVYALISTAFWYLGSRAVITRSLWSRYPPRFAAFMDCPACVGFWWGFMISNYALAIRWLNHADMPVLDIVINENNPLVVGFCMIVLVPLFAGLMQRALWEAGSAADVEHADENDPS